MESIDNPDSSYGAFIPIFEGKENVLEIKNSETSRYLASYKLNGPKVRGIFTVNVFLESISIGITFSTNRFLLIFPHKSLAI